MNPTLESIFDRRSNRGYSPEPVSEEHLELLKKAALASPTAKNAQSWHFSFVTNKELIKSVEEASAETFEAAGEEAIAKRIREGGIFYDAPLAVFISSDKESNWGHVDAGIAVENLALAAHSMGLGSVIIGFCRAAFAGERAEELSKALQFPEGYEFSVAISIGTPTVSKEAHPIKRNKIVDIK